LKIVTVNISDVHGGATRAAKRLHSALLQEGVDSVFLANLKSGNEGEVIGKQGLLSKIIYKIKYRLDVQSLKPYQLKNQTPFSPGRFGDSNIVQQINELEPDIVHLHWIGGAMIKIQDLARIKSPIVWSLHDDWAYTGGCHIKWDCKKYTSACGSCPVLNSNKESDLSHQVFTAKKKVYDQMDSLTVVGLSRWIGHCASESKLLENAKVVQLPNPINTAKFRPSDKLKSRDALNLPADKKLILFGAMNAGGDVRKGFVELKSAINLMGETDVELVVFGMDKPTVDQGFQYKVHYMGNIDEDDILIKLYQSADVCLVPSLQENLSNVIMESLACGTPVVGFKIGGNSDMIDHKVNGYLAKPYEVEDLSEGISYVISQSNQNNLSANSREKVLNNFDEKLVVKRYLELYENIIESKTN